MKEFFLIFLGGGIGSVVRFYVQHFFNNGYRFPLGTFLANIIGSLLIGYFASRFMGNDQHWGRFMFVVGFCGGFTTFSTFSYDTIKLLKQGDYLVAMSYMLSTILISVVAIYIGIFIHKTISK